VQDVLEAVFKQQPFTAAAVCKAAVCGAAHHNQMPAGSIRLFASLATTACHAAISPPSSSSSSRRGMVAAAAYDASLRDALLLQFGLITTQLKYAAGSGNGVNTISALNLHVGPSARAVTKLSKLMEAALGMEAAAGVQRKTRKMAKIT
jgi:hypothetical protein